jgi:large subunit ribosomal protein L22
MPYKAIHKFAKISPTKVRPVAQLIQGKSVTSALEILEFSPRRGARFLEKVLRSALANAGVDAEADEMVVSEARVDIGPRAAGTKRWIPASRGTAHPIKKKTSHIMVVIDESATEGDI